MSVSADNKAIARHIRKAFGGDPRVHAYHHDTEPFSVDLLRCDNNPCEGVTSYSTIGLSDHQMLKDGNEFPTRLEIAGACASAATMFANILVSAAFCMMRTNELYHPGKVLDNYVHHYYPSTPVPHLYVTAPFLWDDSLCTLECDTKTVSWLLAIPISERERDFLNQHGEDDLEELFEKHQIDVFDLARPSVA